MLQISNGKQTVFSKFSVQQIEARKDLACFLPAQAKLFVAWCQKVRSIQHEFRRNPAVPAGKYICRKRNLSTKKPGLAAVSRANGIYRILYRNIIHRCNKKQTNAPGHMDMPGRTTFGCNTCGKRKNCWFDPFHCAPFFGRCSNSMLK